MVLTQSSANRLSSTIKKAAIIANLCCNHEKLGGNTLVYNSPPSTFTIVILMIINVIIFMQTGDQAHQRRPDPAHHLQRVPADGSRQGGDARPRPRPPQGDLIHQYLMTFQKGCF